MFTQRGFICVKTIVFVILVLGAFMAIITYILFKPAIPSCGDRSLHYTTELIPVDQVLAIQPLGAVNPSEQVVPAEYLSFKLYEQPEALLDIHSPGTAWITKVIRHEKQRDADAGYEYTVFMQPCRQVELYVYPLEELAEEISSVIEEKKSKCGVLDNRQICEYSLEVPVYPDMYLGKVLADGSGSHLNLGATDYRTPRLEFANLDRWNRLYRHATCPLDMFTDPVRSDLYELLATSDKSCGSVLKDVKGSAQGIWFSNGAKNTIALLVEPLNQVRGMFSFDDLFSVNGLEGGRRVCCKS